MLIKGHKRKKGVLTRGIAILLLFSTVIGLMAGMGTEEVEAASSYTDAVAFYESTGGGGGGGGGSMFGSGGGSSDTTTQHIEFANNAIYYGTKAIKAASAENLRWQAIAWEITLVGNGASMMVEVEVGGSDLVCIDWDREYNGYLYCLYRLSVNDLKGIAMAQDYATATKIFGASKVQAIFTAVIAKKQGSSLSGRYYLSNSSDLNYLAGIYSSSSYKSWKNSYIGVYVLLTGGGTLYVDYVDRGTHLGSDKATAMQSITTRTVSDLYKQGYHFEPALEWRKQGSHAYYYAGRTYNADRIDSRVAEEDVYVTMETNWIANTYYVQYDSNGGIGTPMGKQECRYDKTFTVWNCNYSKKGYKFIGWSLSPVSTGSFGLTQASTVNLYNTDTGIEAKLKEYVPYGFSVSKTARNLTDEHLATVTLYAVWEPLTCHIDLNEYVTPQEKRLAGTRTLNLETKQWTPGTTALFEVFNTLWSSTDITEYSSAAKVNKLSQAIDKIIPPTKTGHRFLGYFTTLAGTNQVTTAGGKLIAGNTTYSENGTAYAVWDPNTINITFDMNTGSGGSKKTTATYNQPFRTGLTAPTKKGYSFKGYFYTDAEGTVTQIYNEYMMPCIIVSDFTEDVTLVAKWEDDIPPEVNLKLSASTWTNDPDGVIVVPQAWDYGTGLKSVRVTWMLNNQVQQVIYYDNISGGAVVYNSYEVYAQANGKTQSTAHKTEGAYSYTIVATDMNGNEATYSAPVYYDITAPRITGSETEDGYLSITITDLKE